MLPESYAAELKAWPRPERFRGLPRSLDFARSDKNDNLA
jgi:hypothetical protein